MRGVEDIVEGFFLLLLLELLFIENDDPENCEPEAATLAKGLTSERINSKRAHLAAKAFLKRAQHLFRIVKNFNTCPSNLSRNE